MSVTIGPLFSPIPLADSPTVYFEAEVSTRIDNLTVTNTDTVAHTVNIYWVPAGDAPTAANLIISARPLQPGEAWNIVPFIGHELSAGDQIAADADTAAKVNFFGSGTKVSG